MFPFPIMSVRKVIARGEEDAAANGGFRNPYYGTRPDLGYPQSRQGSVLTRPPTSSSGMSGQPTARRFAGAAAFLFGAFDTKRTSRR